MLEEIKNILADCANVDKSIINANSTLREDLNLDSLDCVELLLELETFYDIHIAVDDMKDVNTVNDVMDLVNYKKN